MLRILPLAVLSLGLAPLPPRPDLPKLQGTWLIVRAQIGMGGDPGVFGETTVEIKGDILTITRGTELQSQWQIKIDTSCNPKGMEWVGVRGSKGTTQHGIYRLEDDTFTFCYRADTKPQNFDQTAPEAILFAMKRKKP